MSRAASFLLCSFVLLFLWSLLFLDSPCGSRFLVLGSSSVLGSTLHGIIEAHGSSNGSGAWRMFLRQSATIGLSTSLDAAQPARSGWVGIFFCTSVLSPLSCC